MVNLFTGEDYERGPYNVHFPANVTETYLGIKIIKDNPEPTDNETFSLSIDDANLPNRISVIYNDYSHTTVTIFDQGT